MEVWLVCAIYAFPKVYIELLFDAQTIWVYETTLLYIIQCVFYLFISQNNADFNF